MRVASALIFALCLLVPASLWGGELYNWTDENGIQHFSNQRPENIKHIRVIQAAPESAAPAATAPESTEAAPPAEEATAPEDTAPEGAQPTAAVPENAKPGGPERQLTPQDIERYLGPCYVRYLKKKSANGFLITTNANWMYQIAESMRPMVIKQWQVGDELKICRKRGLIFNITRDPTIAIEGVRVRQDTP